MDTARYQLQTALAAQLDLLSFVTHSRFRITAPLQMMEWEEDQRTRQYDVFHASDPREPPDPELAMPYLESATAIDQSTLRDYTRAALRYFRYGLIDEQPEDQFMRFWLALEIIRLPLRCGLQSIGLSTLSEPSWVHGIGRRTEPVTVSQELL